MNRQHPWYPVVYMFVVTAGFCSILIAFDRSTRNRVRANRALAFERAVLEVFDLHEGTSPGPLHDLFVEKIEQEAAHYVYRDNGQIKGYALPFEGQGFWATIKGVIGLAPDRTTITAISFYQQSETPGLGAEIVKPAFRDQFQGKRIAPNDKAFGLQSPGAAVTEHQVHAITGATQTCTRLEKIIDQCLTTWRDNTEVTP